VKTGFILAEDEAVKLRFSNLTVRDDKNSARPIGVYFRYPEAETERDYPFITIELIDVLHATDRQHSDNPIYADTQTEMGNDSSYFTYWPSEKSDVTGPVPTTLGFGNNDRFQIADPFIPVDLLYQVSTYCRSALHDRQLTSSLLRKVIPFRYNSIFIEADGTTRRFDTLDWTNADLLDTESGYRKRIFRKVITLKMSAEITHQDMDHMASTLPVTSIHSTIALTN